MFLPQILSNSRHEDVILAVPPNYKKIMGRASQIQIISY